MGLTVDSGISECLCLRSMDWINRMYAPFAIAAQEKPAKARSISPKRVLRSSLE